MLRLLRFCVALTVLAVAAVGFASVAQARRRHHHKPKPCAVKGARVVGQTKDKSIRFLTRIQPADDSHDYDRETQYACMPRYKRVVVLNDKSVTRQVETGNHDSFGVSAYHGSLVAYEVEDRTHADDQVGETWDRIEVYVKDLRTGKTLHFDHINGFYLQADLALKPNGSLAYIVTQAAPSVISPGAPTSFANEVRKMDRDGKAVLDSQPGIDPASLTLTGSTVGWKRNGAPFTATIN